MVEFHPNHSENNIASQASRELEFALKGLGIESITRADGRFVIVEFRSSQAMTLAEILVEIAE